MTDKERLENLLKSCLGRLSLIDNQTRQPEQEKVNYFYPIIKFLMTSIVGTILAFNITALISNNKQMVEYHMEISRIQPSTENEITTSINHLDEDSYSFYSEIKLKTNVGKIKKIYLVYADYDNEKISLNCFHEIKFKTSIQRCNILKALVLDNNKNNILSITEFNTTINYNKKSDGTAKHLYLLTIDEENNPNVVLVTVKGEPFTQNTKSYSGKALSYQINPNYFTQPTFKQINPNDFLGNRKLDSISKQFQKDKSEILKAVSEFS